MPDMLDDDLLDLLKIIDECGGRIARASYAGTEHLVQEGYLENSGLDEIGRDMVVLTKKGREALVDRVTLSVNIKGNPDYEAIRKAFSMASTTVVPSGPSQSMTYTIPRGTQVVGGDSDDTAFKGIVIATSDPAHQGLISVTLHANHQIVRMKPTVFLRCFSFVASWFPLQGWAHDSQPACGNCNGKRKDEAGKAPHGPRTGVGCHLCEYTGRQLSCPNTKIDVTVT